MEDTIKLQFTRAMFGQFLQILNEANIRYPADPRFRVSFSLQEYPDHPEWPANLLATTTQDEVNDSIC